MTQQPIKSKEEILKEKWIEKFPKAMLGYDESNFKTKYESISIAAMETYACQQVGEENRRLREAAKELLHLHSCEQEGLQSGKPTFEMWFNAVNKLSEALASVSDAGETDNQI